MAQKKNQFGQQNGDYNSRKRLFLGLMTGACFLVCVLLVLLWVIPSIGFANIHTLAPPFFGGIFFTGIVLVSWAWLSLVLNIVLRRPILFSSRFRGVTIKLFLPLMTLLGRFLGINKESVRNSFIKVNNELVLSEAGSYEPKHILLLMPHCIQASMCDMRLTYDINNCKRCGKCAIKSVLELAEEYGVHVAVATGGTIARRIVVQTRPKLILATACERDLASGIQDTYPIPVYGVLNERPHGPCLDTLVSSSELERALRHFLHMPPLEQPRPGDLTIPKAGEACDLPDSCPKPAAQEN